ncbi:CoA-binding protein [Nannocystis bainbridge]|uniref:CoA-binding protein n=1 Tax=Nannocystis bainbridge TaxID=2995303 RepID=A0ABT5E7J3_9BACT|nr:CoA-binding protein [Nannocystis bainbridge]MDC0721819.1 CoA-binding protein [Nannocystis bainbridge]
MSSPTDSELAEILARARTIAVLGAHTDPNKPACYVPDYLHAAGYTVLPVNPVFAGRRMWGSTFVAALTDLSLAPGQLDMVDVFRRPEYLQGHLPEILAVKPRVVWLQLGIRHAEFARTLREADIEVVEDRCALAEHRRLGLPNLGD